MQIDLEKFRELFWEEAGDHLSTMETALLGLEATPDDHELLDEIFRAAHSIKGASASFGLDEVARFTHVLEGLLERLRSGSLRCTPDLGSTLLRAADVLRGLIAASREGTPPPAETEDVLSALHAALGDGLGATPPAATGPAAVTRTTVEWRIGFAPARELFYQGQDPLLVLRELADAGSVLELVADTSHLPPLDVLDPEQCYLAWTLRLRSNRTETELREIFAFVEDGAAIDIAVVDQPAPAPGAAPTPAAAPSASPAAAGAARTDPPPVADVPAAAAPAAAKRTADGGQRAKSHETSIRVATDKVDRLLDLVGELVIAQSMVSQLAAEASNDRAQQLQEAVAGLQRTTRELQERVMGVRMLPLGSVFGRLPRVVRDVAAMLNKQITLEVSGDDIELDKGIIEGIGDPLTHLIRNAVDHGIEAPQDRERLGKPNPATVRLAAFHLGGAVVIEVADDGKGLDRERIRAKAVASGLIGADDALTDEQIFGCIFQPGFSTAQEVTDVSGRGVGLDVVKRCVEALSGTVSVQSTPGEGTRFRLKLPLTLAILDGLSLRVGEQTFIVPLTSIVESIRPKAGHVKTVLGAGEVVDVRGDHMPLMRLHHILGVPARALDPCDGLVVLVEHEGGVVALLVDELLGQQQVVIKSLEMNFRKADGIMGATILGDGRVALILDIPGIVSLSRTVAKFERNVEQPAAS